MSRAKGDVAEEIGAKFLEGLGFKILERNLYTKFGEVDIIAQKDGVIHFVEVKSGVNFEPIYNITQKKLERIIKSAYVYLSATGVLKPFCIDALILHGDRVELIENITL
ncbi:MAG: YraN family protein [Wolinella sp.]